MSALVRVLDGLGDAERGGAFACAALRLPSEDRFEARFETEDGRDWVEITVSREPRARERAFAVLSHCAVRYRGALHDRNDARRAALRALVMSVATAVDERLARGARTIAEALGRGEGGRLRFDRAGLEALLAPEVGLGRPLADGWIAHAIYPSSHITDRIDPELRLVLELRAAHGEGPPLRVLFGKRKDAGCFAQGAHVEMSYLTAGGRVPEGGERALAMIAFLLVLRDHEGLDVEFPAAAEDYAPPLLAASSAPPVAPVARSLNLAIDAACGQRCAFCAVQDVAPPIDPADDAYFARYLADLRSNRAAGVRRLRLNGYDPLAYPRVIELLEEARALGYEHVSVLSPCTRLADEAFLDRLLAALPASRRFVVPLYATSAARHDRAVGREGAYDQARRGIEVLLARVPRDTVTISTVVQRETLDELGPLTRLADSLGLVFHAQLPYPTTEADDDPYARVAPRLSDVAAELARVYADGPIVPREVRGLPPCVTWRAMAERAVPVHRWLRAETFAPLVPGTEERRPESAHRALETERAAFHAATVPCPHVERCVLREACPREVLRAYAARDGLDELAPIGLEALLRATEA